MMIFNIQRFSTHDGEGIRTIIFFKGCPLRCAWCSNPESQSYSLSVMYDRKLCKGFGDCIRKDPVAFMLTESGLEINRKEIADIDRLRKVCASKALTAVGENRSIHELVREIEKDLPFYNQSRGGVTLSGGEPLAQDNQLEELLRELKIKQIHVAAETTLHVKWENVERCLGLIDTFLVDLKHTDAHKFRTHTQGNLELVLENLQKLAGRNDNIVVRIPVIPGFNHTISEMYGIIDHVVHLKHIPEIHFIPFHNLGAEKYSMLGMNYTFEAQKPVGNIELSVYADYAASKGIKTKIGG